MKNSGRHFNICWWAMCTTSRSVERLLADIRDLVPIITLRAAEIEQARQIPLDLVNALRSVGIFRMFVAKSHGGLELDLPAGLQVIAALSRIEASVGWAAMIGCIAPMFAAWLPRQSVDRVYRDGPDVVLAGSSIPASRAEAVMDGFRVNGRWPFTSGCQYADWMFGFCAMTEGSIPLADQIGPPRVRAVVLSVREWQIEDTWHAIGLKGTGSHDIVLKDATASEADLLDLETGAPCLPGPIYQSVPHLLPLFHGAFAVGVAEGALDDPVMLAESGRQQFKASVPMRDSEIFQFELGQISADARAACALLETQGASHWRHALARTLRDDTLFAQGTQTGTWASTTCVRVVDACFTLAGGGAVYENSSLQRRLRDVHTGAQHATVQRRHYGAAGVAALAQFRDRELSRLDDHTFQDIGLTSSALLRETMKPFWR